MSDPIRDELHRLNEEFRKLLGETDDTFSLEKTTPVQLTKFGLTLAEAESWIKDEPNFSSDASYHEPRNRRKVTRTCRPLMRQAPIVASSPFHSTFFG